MNSEQLKRVLEIAIKLQISKTLATPSQKNW